MSATRDLSDVEHCALVYHTPSRFVDAVAGFVREGLEAADQVMAAVVPEKRDWLREQLGRDADAVDFVDADAMYQRYGPMFSAVLEYLERYGTPGEGGVRIVAEQALSLREPVDVRAYMRFEAASNLAYSRFGASVLCPYDAGLLPEETLRAALRTHPQVLDNGRPRQSGRFMDPRSFVRQAVHDAGVPSGTAPCRLERPDDLAIARSFVRTQAHAAGLAGETVADLLIVVSEVATNALVHGRAPRLLWSYVEGGHLICQVRDAGPGLLDPLAGYFTPDAERLSGRGLWLAHQLCDIVEITSDRSLTNVSLHMRLPAAA